MKSWGHSKSPKLHRHSNSHKPECQLSMIMQRCILRSHHHQPTSRWGTKMSCKPPHQLPSQVRGLEHIPCCMLSAPLIAGLSKARASRLQGSPLQLEAMEDGKHILHIFCSKLPSQLPGSRMVEQKVHTVLWIPPKDGLGSTKAGDETMGQIQHPSMIVSHSHGFSLLSSSAALSSWVAQLTCIYSYVGQQTTVKKVVYCPSFCCRTALREE